MSDFDHPPMEPPTFWEKVIIVATMVLSAIFFPIADKFEGKRKRWK